MLDDDYRLCVRPNGNGCCCEYHMKEYEKRVGRKIDRSELKALVFGGSACGSATNGWIWAATR